MPSPPASSRHCNLFAKTPQLQPTYQARLTSSVWEYVPLLLIEATLIRQSRYVQYRARRPCNKMRQPTADSPLQGHVLRWLASLDYQRQKLFPSAAAVLTGGRINNKATGIDDYIPNNFFTSPTIFSALGTYTFSSAGLKGTGENGAPTRPIGASR